MSAQPRYFVLVPHSHGGEVVATQRFVETRHERIFYVEGGRRGLQAEEVFFLVSAPAGNRPRSG